MPDDRKLLLDAAWGRRLESMWRWMRGFRVIGAESMKNTEDSCVVVVAPRTEQGWMQRPADGWVRINGTYSGQGKYEAYIQSTAPAATNTANLGATNNVSLSTVLADGSAVILWNAAETGSLGNTNRIHLLPTGSYFPYWRSSFSEPYSGTNERAVVLTYAIPSVNC